METSLLPEICGPLVKKLRMQMIRMPILLRSNAISFHLTQAFIDPMISPPRDYRDSFIEYTVRRFRCWRYWLLLMPR